MPKSPSTPTPKRRRTKDAASASAAPAPAPAASHVSALAAAVAAQAYLPLPVEAPTAPAPEVRLPDTGHLGVATLTGDQLAIVTDCTHHLQIEAGAGSGKTKTIIDKILFEQGYGNVPGHVPAARLDIRQIAAITFTRKAAGEITDRLRAEFLRRARAADGADREWWAEQMFRIDGAKIGTLDSFAYGLLREYGPLVGLETGFRLMEQGEGEALYEEVAEAALLAALDRRHADPHLTPGARFLVTQFGFLRSRSLVASLLGKHLTQLKVVTHRVITGTLTWQKAAAKIGLDLSVVDKLLEPHALDVLRFLGAAADRFERRLLQDGLLDYQTVLMKAASIARRPEVQQAFRNEIKLLFVDEHQDSNEAQVQMLFRLVGLDAVPAAAPEAPTPSADNPYGLPEDAPAPATRLILIGDPKQGIYGFRGADITMWRKSLNAVLRHGGRAVELRDNHRSRPALGRFFDHCLSRVMAPERPLAGTPFDIDYQPLISRRPETDGAPVELLLADSTGPEALAEVVAGRVAAMLAHPTRYPVWERDPSGREVARPVRARDIVILSRALRDSADAYERALQTHGIGCFVYGGRGLFAREEIQDLALLLRAVADPTDTFALVAFLRSPLGGVDDLSLTEIAEEAARRQPQQAGRVAAPFYDALQGAAAVVRDPARARYVVAAADLLTELVGLRDRLPHHELLERAITRTRYRAFLAGAPDAPAGVRNIEKLLKIARDAGQRPLYEFVQQLGARVRRADREDEAPIYSPDDDLVVISTIHKAKGLEWPYVIVTGLDDQVVRKPYGGEPRLDTTFGLALPLDVVVRDDTADVPSPDSSRVWTWHADQQMLRDYAEAKRLLYVACTRARDGLVLAGALSPDRKGREIRKPQSVMSDSASWLHLDRYDRWLRHIYPGILPRKGQDPVAQLSVEYGPGPADVLVVSRGLDGVAGPLAGCAAASTADTDSGAATGASDAETIATPKEWPWVPLDGLAAPIPAAAWSQDLVSRLGPVEGRATIRDVFTASELLAFQWCPWKHFWAYRHSVSRATIERAATSDLITEVPPERRGAILHDYLRLHHEAWTHEERHQAMVGVLRRHVAIPMDQALQQADTFTAAAERFLTSDVYARVQAAERAGRPVLREVPFVHQIAPTFRVEGVIDLAFHDGTGWIVVDFKDALFRGIADPVAAKDAQAQKYMIQAALYADAFQAAFGGDGGVKDFIFFFTGVAHPGGLYVTQSVSAVWLEEWRRRITVIVARILAEDYGEAPAYCGGTCETCDYRTLCRPANAPEALYQLAKGTAMATPTSPGRPAPVEQPLAAPPLYEQPVVDRSGLAASLFEPDEIPI